MPDYVDKQLTSLQKQIENLIKPEVPAVTIWTDWTPTVTQSGSVTVTVNYARYSVVNNTVSGVARLTVTGSGTIANNIVIGGMPAAAQPTNAGNANDAIGSIIISDTGTARYQGVLVALTAGGWVGIVHNTPSGGMGIVPSFALANTDVIGFVFNYERA